MSRPTKQRQATPGGGLEASPRGASTRHLVDFYQIGEPFYWHGAKRFRSDVAFRQLKSVGRRKHGTGICHLSHART
jgi:hypothetical protein